MHERRTHGKIYMATHTHTHPYVQYTPDHTHFLIYFTLHCTCQHVCMTKSKQREYKCTEPCESPRYTQLRPWGIKAATGAIIHCIHMLRIQTCHNKNVFDFKGEFISIMSVWTVQSGWWRQTLCVCGCVYERKIQSCVDGDGKFTSFLYCCFSWRSVATSSFRARFLSSSSRKRFTL